MVTVDANALLLQVMAHDLLAPLTAVKWQLEIMQGDGRDPTKEIERLKTMYDSTKLGITLTKHAHVAGQVLVGSYEGEQVAASLPTVIRDALYDLQSQYERHGLELKVNIDEHTEINQNIDVHLVKLLVWSMAKYFLTCVPAHTVVVFSSTLSTDDTPQFVLTGKANNIADADAYVQLYQTVEARDAYDQSYVFAKLIRTAAPLVSAQVSARTQDSGLVLDTTFL